MVVVGLVLLQVGAEETWRRIQVEQKMALSPCSDMEIKNLPQRSLQIDANLAEGAEVEDENQSTPGPAAAMSLILGDGF